ncbi:polyprenyl synthetase family protein [Streptomyces sp. NPDC007861]|uniref:polyprenyl synthetase family protein n=1 Tax=Streptomyces sp. NPDC007861 TaxID=3154893 RepID=UPI0033EECB63
MHDDVMDRSATRRGAPTVQQELAGHYLAQAPRRSGSRRIAQAAAFGNAGAILIGDLALVWSVHMLAASPRAMPGPKVVRHPRSPQWTDEPPSGRYGRLHGIACTMVRRKRAGLNVPGGHSRCP